MVMDRIHQNKISDTKILNVLPGSKFLLLQEHDLSSPFVIPLLGLLKLHQNVWQTAPTAEYLQDQQVSDSLCNCMCCLAGAVRTAS